MNKTSIQAVLGFLSVAALSCGCAYSQVAVEGAAPEESALPFELLSADLSSFAERLANAASDDKFAPNAVRTEGIIPEKAPLAAFIPFLGPEVEKVEIVIGDEKVEKYWQSLTPEQWRRMLQDQHRETTIYKVDSDGGVSYLPFVSVELKKGAYQLKYDNFRYKDYPCSKTDPGAGRLYVGVGLRINANVVSKRKGFKIGFAPFALSANNQDVSGTITADIVGLANSKTLSQVVTEAGGEVSYEGLIKVSNAYYVAGQAIEDMTELTNPRIIGYRDLRSEGSCLAAMRSE